MKKKIMSVAIITTLAITAGWNYQQSKNETQLSDLAKANVEALARSEAAEVECDSWNDVRCTVIIKDSSGAVISEVKVKGINKS